MADSYTNVSFEFPCNVEQAIQLCDLLNNQWNLDRKLPTSLTPIWPDTNAMMKTITGEPADDCLIFGLDTVGYDIQRNMFNLDGSNVSVSFVALAIQSICQPVDPITMEWANTCSKALFDSYGGGVAVIFKDKVVIKDTTEMADEIIEAYLLSQPTSSG